MLQNYVPCLDYQNLEESRNTRGFNAKSLTTRTEKLNIIGFDLNGRSTYKNNEIVLGADGQLNFVNSRAEQMFLKNDSIAATFSRYPDGKNTMHLFGIYAQDVWKIKPNRWILNSGVRWNCVQLKSTAIGDQFWNVPYLPQSQFNNSLTGNVGLVYLPDSILKISLGYSSAFKAPNIDEIGKLSESSAGEYVVVPSVQLRPEYTNNADFGIGWYKANSYNIEFNTFYTLLNNAMILDRVKFSGKDSLLFDGRQTQTVALSNNGKGIIYGASFSGVKYFSTQWQAAAKISYTKGTYDPQNSFVYGGNIVPLDHIAPVFGKVSIKYTTEKFMTEAFTIFNGAKKLSDYNPLSFGEDNLKYATANGTPSWATYNLRGSYEISRQVTGQISVENIFDTFYRQFASGISAGGRNVLVVVRYSM
jgi:hemoglobin/transferrin/lactoferrin receptor protein